MLSIMSLLMANQNDKIIQNYSIHINYVTPHKTEILYVPHLILKLINDDWYKQQKITIILNCDISSEIFFIFCSDLISNNNKLIIDDNINFKLFILSQTIKPNFYSVTTPTFYNKNDFDNYYVMLQKYKYYGDQILNIYYKNERADMLYTLDQYYDIPYQVLNSRYIYLEHNKEYSIKTLAKFEYVWYHHQKNYKEYHHTFVSIRILNDELFIKGPYEFYDPEVYHHAAWKKWSDKNDYVLVHDHCAKKINFGYYGKITFPDKYEYIINSQNNPTFINKSIKLSISDDNNNREYMYIPKSLLLQIDDEYFKTITDEEKMKLFSDQEIGIHLVNGESISGFYAFLQDFLKNDSCVILEIKSAVDLSKYIISYRFNKQNLYMSPYTNLNIYTYIDILVNTLYTNSELFEKLFKIIYKQNITYNDIINIKNKYGNIIPHEYFNKN